MDKKTIAMIVVLAVIIIFYWQILEFVGLVEPGKEQAEQPAVVDTTAFDTGTTTEAPQPLGLDEARLELPPPEDSVAELVATADSLAVDTVVVTTNVYRVTLVNRGGGPISVLLNKYDYRDDYRDGEPVEMLPNAPSVTPELRFSHGSISTAPTMFDCSVLPGEYDVSSGEFEIVYRYTAESGLEITRTYVFYPDSYHYDLYVNVDNANLLGRDTRYTIHWNTPPGVTEPDVKPDYGSMEVVAMAGGSREKLDDYEDSLLQETMTADIEWVGVRSKFFTGVIIPRSRPGESATAFGLKNKIKTPDGELERRQVLAALTMEYADANTVADSFSVYVGPLDYDIMKQYDVDLQDMLGIGTTPVVGMLIKPFALIIIWILPLLYSFVPNYGVVIILTALMMKLVTLPLSLKSFKSMQAMKELQPKLEELKKKHKDKPQQLNQEMMKLYKKHGVNPVAGCLPMLLQMPLFFGFFSVVRATILLRGAHFVWYFDDLSHGATGLTDPYIVLVVIMMGATFISQKLTMASTQQNKMIIYMMPLMMGFFLYSQPAGLLLYWTCFSVFSLIDYFLYRRPKNPQVQTA